MPKFKRGETQDFLMNKTDLSDEDLHKRIIELSNKSLTGEERDLIHINSEIKLRFERILNNAKALMILGSGFILESCIALVGTSLSSGEDTNTTNTGVGNEDKENYKTYGGFAFAGLCLVAGLGLVAKGCYDRFQYSKIDRADIAKDLADFTISEKHKKKSSVNASDIKEGLPAKWTGTTPADVESDLPLAGLASGMGVRR